MRLPKVVHHTVFCGPESAAFWDGIRSGALHGLPVAFVDRPEQNLASASLGDRNPLDRVLLPFFCNAAQKGTPQETEKAFHLQAKRRIFFIMSFRS